MLNETDDLKFLLKAILKRLEVDLEHMLHIESEFQTIKDQLKLNSIKLALESAEKNGKSEPELQDLPKKSLLSRLGFIRGVRNMVTWQRLKSSSGLWVMVVSNFILTICILIIVIGDRNAKIRKLDIERDNGEITLGNMSIRDAVQLDRPRYINDRYCVLFLSKFLLGGSRLFLDWASKERLDHTNDEYRIVNNYYCKSVPALPLPDPNLPKELITPVERKYCCYDGRRENGMIKGVWQESCRGNEVLIESACVK